MTWGSHHRYVIKLVRRGSTFLDRHVAEAVRSGLDEADDKNPKIFSSSIRTPLLERGLTDVVDLHLLPCLRGDGARLYDVAGGSIRKRQDLVGDDPNAATNLYFRTTDEI
jgi:hypothetical protein